jgi:hypothetical protein
MSSTDTLFIACLLVACAPGGGRKLKKRFNQPCPIRFLGAPGLGWLKRSLVLPGATGINNQLIIYDIKIYSFIYFVNGFFRKK